MKNLLIIYCLLISFSINGQFSIRGKSDTTTKIITRYYTDTMIIVYDTIKCVMLVSDTTKQTITNERWKLTCDTITDKISEKKVIDTISFKYDHSAFWKSGYYITRKHSLPCFYGYYLDADKKRLPKNYIVWDYRTKK